MDKKSLESLWTKEDARAFLQLPLSTFNLYLAKGEFPFIKIGRHVRFIPEQMMAWAKRKAS